MATSPDNNAELLDEIDIDAILSQSIGSTGRIEVPSAEEELPSLIEEDFIDVQTLLNSLKAEEEAEKHQTPEETPTLESEFASDLLEEMDINFFEEAANHAAQETPPITPSETFNLEDLLDVSDNEMLEVAPAMHSEIHHESSHTETPDQTDNISSELCFPTLEDSTPIPPDTAKIKLSTLLKQESEIVTLGRPNLPPIPDIVPAAATRRFRTKPRYKLKPYQIAACVQLFAILIWCLFVGKNEWKERKAKQLAQNTVHPKKIRPKVKKAVSKPTELASLSTPTATTPTPPTPPPPPPPPPPAIRTHQEVLSLRGSTEEPHQIQCDISMDSDNIREELKKCLNQMYQAQ